MVDRVLRPVFLDILHECDRQDAKWGEQNHLVSRPGDPCPLLPPEDLAKHECDDRTKNGDLCWSDILLEEVCEAHEAKTPEDQYTELIQVAAVAMQAAESIRRRVDFGES